MSGSDEFDDPEVAEDEESDEDAVDEFGDLDDLFDETGADDVPPSNTEDRPEGW